MKLIPLGGKRGVGKFLKIDNGDYETASKKKWFLSKRGYPCTSVYDSSIYKNRAKTGKGKNWSRPTTYHQFIMGKRQGFFIDHIDGNTCNGQRSNFRWATPGQSVHNTGTKKLYKGSQHFKKTGRNQFKSEIMVNWKKTHIGVWPSAHIAALAYDFWAVQLHGEFARTNFEVIKWG